ncbi:amidase [Mesorhizobium sp. CAU 1732]|uniref:amidase n=1 Tax=Mesorhizobium sp. CAU 1732 TaxID=3140358 RepID=UPI00326064A0
MNLYSSASELARAVRARKIGAQELLDAYLVRVDKLNPELNAIVVRVDDEARKAARDAEKAVASGDALGPFHGVPMTVKESFSLAGTPTTYGLPPFRDNIAGEDALAVRRLKTAGAIVFGKTNVPPALADAQSANPIYGRTNNPWALDRTPGGSSGGSAAALAAGLTALELGSDIASSLRNPAHYCGVYAHKPTYGLCSSEGHWLRRRHALGDISVIGPMARSAEDLETAFAVIADHSQGPSGATIRPHEVSMASLRGLKVAVVTNDDYAPVDRCIENEISKLAAFLCEEGAEVAIDARPDLESQRVHLVYELLMRAAISQEISDEEVAAFEAEKLDDTRPTSQLRSIFLDGVSMSHRAWLRLNEERQAMYHKWHEFFTGYDVLLSPVLATPAFPHDDRIPAWRTLTVNGVETEFGRQLFWAGYTGAFYLPSTAVPIGLSDGGLPIGIQIVGDRLDDLKCLRFARLLEERYRAFQSPPGYPPELATFNREGAKG